MEFSKEYLQGEYREGFYISSMVKRAFAVQLDVLETVKTICEKHNIRYFADWGTMLGAVRHGGFVPWDDDIDICMLRDDYVRFREAARQELPEEYQLLDIETTPGFNAFIVRLVNGNQIVTGEEKLEKRHGCPYVVGIDIFILDYLPRDIEQKNLQCTLIKILYETICSCTAPDFTEEKIEELAVTIEELLGQPLSKKMPEFLNELYVMVDKLSGMYRAEEADEVCFMMDYALGTFASYSVADFKSMVEIPFETTTIAVPVGYDSILKKKYGNYRDFLRGGSSHDYPFFREQAEKLKEALDTGTISASDEMKKLFMESMQTVKKPIAVEKDGYMEFVDKGIYYVDKSEFLRQFPESKVTLYLSPRRWGKTMLFTSTSLFYNREFERFDSELNPINRISYFDNLKMDEKFKEENYGKESVLFFSLKNMVQVTMSDTLDNFRRLLTRLYVSYSYVLFADCFTEEERAIYEVFQSRQFGNEDIVAGFKLLVQFLAKFNNRPIVFMLDHYDTGFEKAYELGFYEEYVEFIRDILEAVAEDGASMKQLIINGEHYVAGDVIFRSFKDMSVIQISDACMDGYLGYTEEEVTEMLRFYHMSEKLAEAKEWFGGFKFCGKELYNPWDINNYVLAKSNGAKEPYPFWINATPSAMLKRILLESKADVLDVLQLLINGDALVIEPHSELDYNNLSHNREEILNYLYQSGYFTVEKKNSDGTICIKIPNKEIRDAFERFIEKDSFM